MIKDQPSQGGAVTWMQPAYASQSSFESRVLSSAFDKHEPLGELDVPLDFAHIDVECIERYTASILYNLKSVHDYVASLQDKQALSFELCYQPLINMDVILQNMVCLVSNMSSFHPDDAVRNACIEAQKQISDLNIECMMRHDVYCVRKAYFEGAYLTEKTSLSPEEQRLVEETMRASKREGLHLDEDTRAQVLALKKQISKNEIDFNHNLDEEKTSFEFTRDQLKGLPDSFFNDERHLRDDIYKVTLKYPDFLPVMDYCQERETRRQLFEAYDARCIHENTPLFEQTIHLRQQLAQLLGYPSYSHIVTEPKMAKTPEFVQEFLGEMNRRFTPLLEHDLACYQKLACEEHDTDTFTLAPWDMRYYTRMHKEKQCNLDQDTVRQYFPLPVVLRGMLDIYHHVLGLKFVEVDTQNKWHPDVKAFAVYNQTEDGLQGEYVGRFYLDLYPREGKYGHAAMFDFVNGCDISKITGHKDERRKPVIAMACNFPATECLEFDDVVTLFHEFGHVMHGICSRTQLAEYAGTNVQRDFVEAPSQMLEFWCYEPEVLKRMSAHKVTGEAIPDDLIAKLKQSEQINQGYTYKRQLFYGLYDMAVHTLPLAKQTDFNSALEWSKLYHDMFGIDLPATTNGVASFGHIMGGYESGYYGYLLTETFATDMYYTCFKGNPLNPDMGQLYRRLILEPGGSRDAMELLKDLLGREPQLDAFLQDKGLSTVSSTAEAAATADLDETEEEYHKPTLK